MFRLKGDTVGDTGTCNHPSRIVQLKKNNKTPFLNLDFSKISVWKWKEFINQMILKKIWIGVEIWMLLENYPSFSSYDPLQRLIAASSNLKD